MRQSKGLESIDDQNKRYKRLGRLLDQLKKHDDDCAVHDFGKTRRALVREILRLELVDSPVPASMIRIYLRRKGPMDNYNHLLVRAEMKIDPRSPINRGCR